MHPALFQHMKETMALLKDINVIQKDSLYYFVQDGKKNKRKPWLGDLFSPLYDRIMEKNVYPKKLNADRREHLKILQHELGPIRHGCILELGTGTGDAVPFLSSENEYTGIDVSPGLLKQAHRRLLAAGFTNFELYVTSAAFLPFQDEQFDACLCFLSLNFFPDVERLIQDLKRLLVPKGVFLCCVPVPERHETKATIHGTLYSEKDLKAKFAKYGFQFQSLPYKNGSLLYFKALT